MDTQSLKLGVNIDHIATLRQARKTSYPGILDAARLCEEAGAGGITVHLREDRRHIQDRDVFELRERISTRLNLEMASSPDIVAIALRVLPHEVCMVPERREELTTEGGLDIAGHRKEMQPVIAALSQAGIVVSLFVDPEPRQIECAKELGAQCIELHTGTFCNASGVAAALELERLTAMAKLAHRLGIQVNAGHGINMDNIRAILTIPHLDTLNIGHSIVSRAVFIGLKEAVREMLAAMLDYEGGRI